MISVTFNLRNGQARIAVFQSMTDYEVTNHPRTPGCILVKVNQSVTDQYGATKHNAVVATAPMIVIGWGHRHIRILGIRNAKFQSIL